ncbi:MAG: hypothetical protein HQK56_07320 [Deltaproteobacteria bacterium]|nr:hypothetical protein [Deltaproteobacteria bacterium]
MGVFFYQASPRPGTDPIDRIQFDQSLDDPATIFGIGYPIYRDRRSKGLVIQNIGTDDQYIGIGYPIYRDRRSTGLPTQYIGTGAPKYQDR